MTDRDPFEQLIGTFDLPVAPSPAFAARLRSQVVAEIAQIERESTVRGPVSPVAGGTKQAALQNGPLGAARSNGTMHPNHIDHPNQVIVRLPRRPNRRLPRPLRWLPALEVVAAVVLVITVFGQLIDSETVRNAIVPDLFEPAGRLKSPMSDAPTGDLPATSLSGRDPAAGLLVATPLPIATPAASPIASSTRGATERSLYASGSWTFDAAVPANAPDMPEVIPPTDEGKSTFSADVEGDTLVRLVGTSQPGLIGNQAIEALSLTTGERLWVMPFENASVPIVANRRIFFHDAWMYQVGAERAASIYALDLATGDLLWRVPFTGQLVNAPPIPLVVESTLYVADALGAIQALDVMTGQPRWNGPDGVERAVSPGGAPLVEWQSVPVADNQHLYVHTVDGVFRALDLETGQPVWEQQILGTFAARIYAVNAMTDGTTVVLNVSTVTENGAATPAVFSGPALTTVALDALDGRLLWQRAVDIDSLEGSGIPVLADGLLLTYNLEGAPNGRQPLTALRAADGQEVWQSDVIPYRSPVWSVGNNHAVGIVPDGSLIAIDLADGAEAWRVAMAPVESVTPPLITEDSIIVVSTDGRIVVWRTDTPSAPSPTETDQAEPPLVATPSPDARVGASPATTPVSDSSGSSTLAGGSWTFDTELPASAPGTPKVIPPTDEGKFVLDADVADDTLVRLVANSLDQYGVQHIEAVSLATGARRWNVPVVNASAPVIADGRVFVLEVAYLRVGTERSIVALDLATGEELWRVPFTGQPGEFPASPLVVGSMLYVADDLGVIQALDVATGDMRWQAPDNVERARTPTGEQLIEAQSYPNADEQHIYVLTADGVFHALALETGLPVWSEPILGKYADRLYAFPSMTDGATVILNVMTPLKDSNGTGTPSVFGGPVQKTVTIALGAENGRPLWQRAGDADSAEFVGAESIADGLVLSYGLDGTLDGRQPLTALSAVDGQAVWQSDVIPNQTRWWSGGRNQAVAIVPGGTLVAIDLATGEEVWRVAMPPIEPSHSPLITEDAVVVVSQDGWLLVWRI